jgi:hypothetical protein
VHYSITAAEMIFVRSIEGKVCTKRIINHKSPRLLKINMLEGKFINNNNDRGMFKNEENPTEGFEHQNRRNMPARPKLTLKQRTRKADIRN